MKKARYQFCPGRQKPHKISFWREDGSRAAKFFENEGDALIFQAQRNQSDESGLPDNLMFSVDERILFAQIRSECAQNSASLEDALSCLKKHLKQFVSIESAPGLDWAQAVQMFLDDFSRRGARPSSLKFYKSLLKLFFDAESPKNVKEISPKRAEKYLESCKSPAHAKRTLRAFFNFLTEKGFVSQNPFKDCKLPRRLKEFKNPEILTVYQTEKFLKSLPKDWQPAAAIMAFAGVRPSEIVSPDCDPVLKISNIDFKSRRISVPAEVSKTRRLRILAQLPANLWRWVEPLRKISINQNVAPQSYNVWRKVKDSTGVELPKDVLRHSFASYGYHFLGAEHTVEILGHVGGFGVFAKHYKGLATPAEAKRYFKIEP